MNWTRVKDRLPADQQEVLIRHRSIIYLGVYNSETDSFILREGKNLRPEDDYLWSSLIDDTPMFKPPVLS